MGVQSLALSPSKEIRKRRVKLMFLETRDMHCRNRAGCRMRMVAHRFFHFFFFFFCCGSELWVHRILTALPSKLFTPNAQAWQKQQCVLKQVDWVWVPVPNVTFVFGWATHPLWPPVSYGILISPAHGWCEAPRSNADTCVGAWHIVGALWTCVSACPFLFRLQREQGVLARINWSRQLFWKLVEGQIL